MKRISIALLSLSVLSVSAFATEMDYVPGEVLVKVKPGQMRSLLSKRSSLGAEVKKQINAIAGDFVLLKTNSRSTEGLLAEMNASDEVIYAEPNYIAKAIGFERVTDPKFKYLWGLSNTGSNEPTKEGGFSSTPGVAGADIDAHRAWEITKGDKKVVIAVIDTGIDYNHEDLKNNIWINTKEIPGNGIDDDGNGYVDDVHGWNAVSDHGDPMDDQGHGTHCAGTIGAEHNEVGVSGVMAHVSMMPVKFLNEKGSGNMADAVEAIDYATKMNVDIMSNSWGGGGKSNAVREAIEAAEKKGILFVAAAGNTKGNDNDKSPHYPSSYIVGNIIAVASHTAQDTLSPFSCFGAKSVHVGAPGSNILSTLPGDKYAVYSGTSMATPHVSGVLGLLLSKTGRLPVAESKGRLIATVTPTDALSKNTVSGGRVNAFQLLTNTSGPSDADAVVLPLNEVFETAHPYTNLLNVSKTYNFPKAKYVKVVVAKYGIKNYDSFSVKDANGNLVEKLTDGSGENVETKFVKGSSVTLEFKSNIFFTEWGVLVKEVKVIY